jgi:hypothetical protein
MSYCGMAFVLATGNSEWKFDFRNLWHAKPGIVFLHNAVKKFPD